MSTYMQWKAPFNAAYSAAQSLPGFNRSTPHTYENLSEQGTPLYQPSPKGFNSHVTAYNPSYQGKPRVDITRLKNYRRWLRIIATISQIFSAIFALALECAMAYVLYKYYTTKPSEYNNTQRLPWPKHTKTWPAIMLLAASVLTFTLSIAILVALCRRSKRSTALGVIYVVVHVGVWIAVAALYRLAKSKSDLWGWACSKEAQQVQKWFKDDINYKVLCKIQGSSWFVTLSEVGVKIVCYAAVLYFYIKQLRVRAEIAETLGNAVTDTTDTGN